MLIKRKWLLIVIALIVLIGTGLGISSCNIFQSQRELALSQYPSAFKKNTLIVVGENASSTESEAAEAVVADLAKYKGDVPEIKNDAEVTEKDKGNHNLILIGIKGSNRVLTEVLEKNKAEMITDAYPGENKGVIEILSNPWNSERVVLVIAGSDEKGLRAGSEILKFIYELDKASVVVDWEQIRNDKLAVSLGLTPSEFEVLGTVVREYLCKKYPFLSYTEYGINYEKVNTKIEGVSPESVIIDAHANFRTPPVVVRAVIYDGTVEIISVRVIEEDA